MIKLLRQGALEKPWVLRIIIISIALAFLISMGWFGFSQPGGAYVALVDEVEISRKEYRRAYQNAYRFYREMLQDQFTEDQLGQIVINGMIDRHLWIMAAKELQVEASFQGVKNALRNDRSFFRKGRFDPEQYRFVLANSRPPLHPEEYENNMRDDLSIDRVKAVIRDGIILTDSEAKEAREKVTGTDLSPEDLTKVEEQALRNALSLKKQRALAAYLDAVRTKTPIEINEIFL